MINTLSKICVRTLKYLYVKNWDFIFGGSFTTTDPGLGSYSGYVRLNSDGTQDSAFTNVLNASYVEHVCEQNGKIIIAGPNSNTIYRVNTDGSIDNTFTVINTSYPFHVSVQSDNKLIVTGGGLFRYNSDGTEDTGFSNRYVGGTHYSSIQSNGKIIITGFFTEIDSLPTPFIARLNSDGTLDETFDVGTGFNSFTLDSAIQSDGKIIVVGAFNSCDGVSLNSIARLNSDGSVDTNFSTGSGFNGVVERVELQDDGKIIAVGQFSSYNDVSRNRIARLNTDGTLDTSFSVGTGFNNVTYNLFIQDDSKIVVVGAFTSYNNTSIIRIAKLNSDGSLDTTFNPKNRFNNTLRNVFVQSNGKIIACGDMTYTTGTDNNRLLAISSAGTIDEEFITGSGFNNTVNAIRLQNDGKIIFIGNFTNYKGTTSNRIARLNPSSSLDSGFNIGTGFNSTTNSIAIQGDGKVLVGGSFTSYNGTSISRIARLNTDGTLDTGFSVGTGYNTGAVSAIAIQSDGKIITGGGFTSYNGTSISRIARLNSDGSIDTGFSVGTGFNNVINTIIIQSDGKIIAAGAFTTYNGTSINRIIRLNTDGTIDSGFTVGTGFDSTINSMSIQSDGKIVVGGFFSSYSGTSISRIVRLNTDGSRDTGFSVGTGFNNTVSDVAVQDGGKILVVGSFTAYNGTTRNRIVKLNSDGTLDTDFNFGANNSVVSILK